MNPKPSDPCPNCGGSIAARNPTGSCDHLYWPEYLTPEAKRKIAQNEALLRAVHQRAVAKINRLLAENGQRFVDAMGS